MPQKELGPEMLIKTLAHVAASFVCVMECASSYLNGVVH